MTQIKTIWNRLNNEKRFDEEVNQALNEGWELVDRRILPPQSQSHDNCVLYAELEKGRDPVQKEKRDCRSCKHRNIDILFGPCNCCRDHDKWEPKESTT